MADLVPVFRPILPTVDQVTPYLREIDASRIYSNQGPLVQQLEEGYGEFLGVSRDLVIAVSSGTSGLIASLLASTPSRWVTPAWTFVATPQSLMRAGKVLVPWDVDDQSAGLSSNAMVADPEAGILPVVPFGAPPVLDDYSMAPVCVIDAAASLAVSQGRLSRIRPDWSVVFSLHATKIMGCGEGGVVICGSTELSERVRASINFGLRDRVTTGIHGLNGKMSEISAAYALAALSQAPLTIETWRHQANKAASISDKLGIRRIAPREGAIGPYWVLKVAEGKPGIELVQREMSRRGIETRRWWPETLAEMSNSRIPSVTGRYPYSDDFAATALGLPLSVDQTPSEFDRIEEALIATRGHFELN